MRKLADMLRVGAALLITCSGAAGDCEEVEVAARTRLTVTAAVAPRYSPVAVALGISGDVEVVVTLDHVGNARMAEAVTGHALLQPSAIDAAKRWKFVQAGGVRVVGSRVEGDITESTTLDGAVLGAGGTDVQVGGIRIEDARREDMESKGQQEERKVILLFSFRILQQDSAEDAAGATFLPPNHVEVRSKPAPRPPVQYER